jgi:uncharacterized protein
VTEGALLERRLATFRAIQAARRPAEASVRRRSDHAERLAAALDASIVRTPRGTIVRRDPPAVELPLDRARLATLPGQPPADVPLVCLDTETTGLATASGTVAFLVGVGTWHGTAFRQVQLLLPEHPDEPAFLEALAALIPHDGWLVTYNGRGFDWPLLVARYRMDRRPPPPLAGHLDLLPIVRRLFRHRLPDARLRTTEEQLLRMRRHGDVDGWEIPGRYLDFVRGGSAAGLVDVVRHNELDVRSLAGLLGHLERELADPVRRVSAPWGDLAGLARLFRRERRHDDALECLDAALDGWRAGDPARVEWHRPGAPLPGDGRRERDRIAAERARTLRRLGRHGEALEAWRQLSAEGGPLTGIATVEVAKALEHTWADPAGALEAVERGRQLTGQARALGRPMPLLEADLSRRRTRLTQRLARRRTGRASAN